MVKNSYFTRNVAIILLLYWATFVSESQARADEHKSMPFETFSRAISERRVADGHLTINYDALHGAKSICGSQTLWVNVSSGQVRVETTPVGQSFIDGKCYGCGGEDNFLRYSSEVKNQNKLMPSLRAVSELNAGLYPVPNIAIFGIFPLPFLSTGKMSLGNLNRILQAVESATQEDSVINDEKCIHISFKYSQRVGEDSVLPFKSIVDGEFVDIIQQYWILPEKKFSIARACLEVVGQPSGNVVVSVLDSHVEFHSPSDCWFPNQITYTSSVNGVENVKERLLVTTHSLNQGFAVDPFDISNISGIQPGDRIGVSPQADVKHLSSGKIEPGVLTWDGTQLVSATTSLTATVKPAVDDKNSFRFWVLVFNLGFVIGFILLGYWRGWISNAIR